MYKKTILENTDELLRACRPAREQGDTFPSIGRSTLVFENDMDTVRLECSDTCVELSSKVTAEEVIKALANHANLDVHIT